ncbi:LOW QUALITY PROTEIN: jerky protein homolog-like [Bactrocera neohumeralis]|uniref:LOW QUALITY PROTEIN: jerky protein homolog-like n=1 Tax=Bactrocera neohumeralis TaxID=98809 RepID=UPI0021667E28|nr:LOW QUALITY PROTEIN: jerky protein homolog-like [Bactrocera neohumeralis]
MEKSLYLWFIRMRGRNCPVSGLMLKEKAKELHSLLKENSTGFNASDGWLQRFKKRYGVRLLKVSGEKLSSQPQLVDPFKLKLKQKIEEMELCNDQLYNADESGLFWKILPDKTYVSSHEKPAPGTKTEKQRITFLCCANASGAHKLKLLVIGKAKNPRSFKHFPYCPTDYKNSKSAWMTSAIFKHWFHQSFVPQVRLFLKRKNLPIKALLLIDNAPSHPSEAELKTEDGNIIDMFMPPNVTPLIQPMDQNAIKITKLYYRNSLLASIAAKNLDLLESMKNVTLKDAVTLLSVAWDRVSTETLANCWKNILSLMGNEEDPEYNIPLNILKDKWSAEINSLIRMSVDLLQDLSLQVEFTLPMIREWNDDPCVDDATEIHKITEIHEIEESDDDDCIAEDPIKKIAASVAVEIFNKALQWAGDAMVDQSDMSVLRRLREKAVFQLLERKNQQKKITDFFNE